MITMKKGNMFLDRRRAICYDVASSPVIITPGQTPQQRSDQEAVNRIIDGLCARMPDLDVIKQLNQSSTDVTGLVKQYQSATDLAIQEVRARVDALGRTYQNDTDVQVFRSKGGDFMKRVSPDLGTWFLRVWKAKNGLDTAELRELNSNVGADGGYTVVPEYSAELQTLFLQYGLFRQYAFHLPMKSNERIWPILQNGVVAYWIVENNALIESFPSFGQATMFVKTLVGLTHLPIQLLEDSDQDLMQLLANVFARAIAQEEDHQGFMGTGAGNDPFKGVMYETGTQLVLMNAGRTSFAQISYDDLVAMQSAMPRPLLDGARYWMHRSIYNQIRVLRDTLGRPLFSDVNSLGPTQLAGYPLEISENMPALADSGPGKPLLFFGNLQNAYLGIRKEVEIARSDHSLFGKLQSALRVHERVCVKIAQPKGFVILQTAIS